jgi:hypothetical protein
MSTDMSEVCAVSIIRAITAARTSETSVDIKVRTRQYIPEDSELHTRAMRTWNLTSTVMLSFLKNVFTFRNTHVCL